MLLLYLGGRVKNFCIYGDRSMDAVLVTKQNVCTLLFSWGFSNDMKSRGGKWVGYCDCSVDLLS